MSGSKPFNSSLSFSRRSLLVASASTIIEPVRLTQASQKPVWRNYSQEDLDKSYDQLVWAPDLARFVERFASGSQRTRDRLGAPLRLKYGKENSAKADFFSCGLKSAPLLIFIHGGAWRLGSAKENAFVVEPFVRAGAHVLIPDFPWVQDVNNSLYPIVTQLRKMMTWVVKNTQQLNVDSKRIYMAGHSSGAHLASVLLTTNWQEHSLPKNLFKGGLCSSGMFDLEPVSLSARRNYIDFTPQMVSDLSPIRHLANLHCPLVVSYGSLESPEFKRQSIEFSNALSKEAKTHELVLAQGFNHFEVLETLANPYGFLGAATLKLMGLGPG